MVREKFKALRKLEALEKKLEKKLEAPAKKLKVRGKAVLDACSCFPSCALAVNELESAILWQRILVHQDGRPLSAAEIASGQFGVGGMPSVPLPPPLSVR